MKTYKLPPAFYDDHTARALPEEGVSTLVRRTKRYVEVEMDTAAYADLHSDCEYYTDPAIAADMGLFGLASSARATLKALDAQGAPEPDYQVNRVTSMRADGTLYHHAPREVSES